jgi:hypothetical protein
LKQFTRIGPWTTTNIADNPAQIQDNELAYSENVVIDGKGGLRPRPGFNFVARPAGMATGPASTTATVMLGTFFGKVYVSVKNGTAGFYLWRYDINAGTWSTSTLIGSGFDYTPAAAFSYGSEVYFVASKFSALTKGGYKYNPSTGSQTYVPNLPFLPAGAKYQKNAFIYKERAWVINGSRVSYSKATDPTDWTVVAGGAGFFDIDVNQDTSGITAYAVLNDVMYFFKRTATYSFNYYLAPDTDGQLRRISSTQGALEGSAVGFKNRVFIYDNTNVYEIINNQFILRSETLGLFKYFSLIPDAFSLNGQRVSSGRLHFMADYLVLGPIYQKTFGSGAYGDTLLVSESYDAIPHSKTWYLVYDTNTNAWFFWTNICNNTQQNFPSFIGEWATNEEQTIFFSMIESTDYYDGGSGTGNLVKIDFSNLDFFFTTPAATTQLGFPDYSSASTKQYPPYRFTTKTFDFGSKFSIKKIYKIYYSKFFKPQLPNYTADTNYSFKVKYFMTYFFQSRILGINVDQTRNSSTTKNFGLLPSSQGRVTEMALGMEFKMLTNTNLSASNAFNFYVDGFEAQYETKNVTSKDSTL